MKQMTAISVDSYNQAVSLEIAEPLRAAEGGDTKPKVLIIKDEDEETKRWISRPKFIGSEKRRMGSGNVSNVKRHSNSVSAIVYEAEDSNGEEIL